MRITSTSRRVIAFGVGAVGFSLIEYLHHRYGGHVKGWGKALYISHQRHHGDPPEGGVTYREKLRQRFPLVLKASAGISATLFPVLGRSTTTWMMAGLLGGYAYSEWFHHTMHHRAPRNEVERWMWRYHYIHHFENSKVNFGFTSPFWDYVFGTAAMKSDVTVPANKIPDWPADIPGFYVESKRHHQTDSSR